MSLLKEDITLKQCLTDKQEAFRQFIAEGRPYVWQLRIRAAEFDQLEALLRSSVDAHHGSHQHLLTADYALLLVIYFAEWYKRVYRGRDTGDDAPVVNLEWDERVQLWALAGIDSNTFVYNASENPDKPLRQWKYCLRVLGGLAVRDELRRDEHDPFLSRLCKIYHGEEIDMNDVVDRERAVAFQQSIIRGHSLYYYVEAILRGDYPFAEEDLADPASDFHKLIHRIETADWSARKNKFDFEWLISYAAYYKQMVRRLKVRLKPEALGGKYKQYIGYDRLRDFWEIDHPEQVGRLLFDLRFKMGSHTVKEATFKEPILTFSNTGSEKTGFVAADDVEEIIYLHVPTVAFDRVELMLRYDGETRRAQDPFMVEPALQVYKVAGNDREWSSRKRPQSATAVIFPQTYRLIDVAMAEQVVRVPFRDSEKESDLWSWCPIYDQVTLMDEHNHPHTFYNRNGFYQVVARKYLKTIKYEENLYVTYKFIELDEDEDLDDYDESDYITEQLPLLFGREGLQVRYYANTRATEWTPEESYELQWMQSNGRYVDWSASAPSQGKLRLRITVKGMVMNYKVYYVPFKSTEEVAEPIWRDFDKHAICFAVDGKEDIVDKLEQDKEINDTLKVTLGEQANGVEMDVYRPYLLKQLFQNGELVENIFDGQDVEIPLLMSNEFTIRDFGKNGVADYDCSHLQEGIYRFDAFHIPSPTANVFTERKAASELTTELPLDYLYGYLTKSGDVKKNNAYEWDYKSDPNKVDGETTLTSGIVFQSRKDDQLQRHYIMHEDLKAEDTGWWFDEPNPDMVGFPFAADVETKKLDVFKTIVEHKVYFFLFKPMRDVIIARSEIEEIALPLIIERKGELSEEEISGLYRMAREFHFDWMLESRNKWEEAINNVATNEEEKVQYALWVTDFFAKTPKATDEQECRMLREFLKGYWGFNHFTTNDPLAQKALKKILGVENALSSKETEEGFLTAYDGCRYKFSEMTRIHQVDENSI